LQIILGISAIKINGRPNDHHGVYEMKLKNGSIEGYEETDKEKTDIRYTNEEDARKKIEEGGVVFEFLYKHDKSITEPCCVVGFQDDPKLGVAMVVVIY
jgi:hypothetical protein